MIVFDFLGVKSGLVFTRWIRLLGNQRHFKCFQREKYRACFEVDFHPAIIWNNVQYCAQIFMCQNWIAQFYRYCVDLIQLSKKKLNYVTFPFSACRAKFFKKCYKKELPYLFLLILIVGWWSIINNWRRNTVNSNSNCTNSNFSPCSALVITKKLCIIHGDCQPSTATLKVNCLLSIYVDYKFHFSNIFVYKKLALKKDCFALNPLRAGKWLVLDFREAE